MFRKKPIMVVLLGILSVLLLVSPGSALEQMEPTFQATVSGGPQDGLQRLKMFNDTLMAHLGVTDLALADIGCVECADLDSGPPEESLTYFIPERTYVVLAFAMSWRDVQASKPHDLFTLQFSSIGPPQPVCPAITGCKARAACPQTDYCDKPWGGLCNAC